jgi:putative transposase
MTKREFHPPHIYHDDSCYFLTGSVVRGQKLFGTRVKRDLLQDILKEAIRQYGIRLYAWVILPTHYHLLLKTSDAAPIWKFVKRFHGESAIKLNKLDEVTGRTVWYQYWDRFPRSDEEFWSYFNYIHVNPIKHGYVQVSGRELIVENGNKIPLESPPDVNQCLLHHPHSSFRYYLDRYGEEFLINAFRQYPIPDYLAHDDF